jgi:hypothetical protein
MRPGAPILCALAVLWLGACAGDPGAPVSAAADPLAVLPPQATFAWSEPLPVAPDANAATRAAIRLRRTVQDELAARGWRPALGTPPDFLLHSEFALQTLVHDAAAGSGGGAERALGSFSLLVFDAADERPLWAGFARVTVDLERSAGREPEPTLRESVRRLLDALTPAPED